MAVMRLELDVGLTGPALTAGLPPISALRLVQGLAPEAGRFEALSQLARKVWYGKIQASYREEGTPPEELQNHIWGEFFLDPIHWWDNRRSKPVSRPWDAGKKRPPESIATSVPGQGSFAAQERHSEVEICSELCKDGRITDAVDALHLLVQRGCHVQSHLFYLVLKRCIASKNLVLGRNIHALIVKSGYQGDPFLATHLMGMYASQGSLHEAMEVFTKVSTADVYNWATIIFAYAKHGEAAQAIRLYQQMRESTVKPDNRIYVAVLKACATAGNLVAGKEVHGHILASPGTPDIFVQTGLLAMYAKCGSLEDARRVFDRLPDRNVVTWTAMIAGYAQQGMGQEALSLYSRMMQEGLSPPDSVTFVCLLKACASVGVGALNEGKLLHAQTEKQGLQDDVALGCSLVNMYAKCGSLGDARAVFDRLPNRNLVTWTAMIGGYAQQGMGQEALSLYSCMQDEGLSPPDPCTFVCLLQACASVGVEALHQGKQLHAQIEERGLQADVGLGSSLVNMYTKCGSIENARSAFDRLPERDAVTWTAMIAGYAHQGMGREALGLYSIMQQEGLCPADPCTFVCLLQACAIVAGLPMGKQLHAQIKERGMQADVVVGAALVNMYAKCGSMVDSQQVFDSLPDRSIEAWGALIGGYTRQGNSEIVFALLDRMTLEGTQPNGVTFLSVLTVCSHAGLVDKGRKYFEVMGTEYGISPTVEHYTCMLDLLGRAGHLDEALQIAKSIPFPPNGAVWRAVLSACQKWNNVEIGQHAFECAVGVDPKDDSSYVLMFNIYTRAQMLEEAREIQARRLKCGAFKKPGQCWWTDMGGVVHTFVVGDRKHAESAGLHARLEQLVPLAAS